MSVPLSPSQITNGGVCFSYTRAPLTTRSEKNDSVCPPRLIGVHLLRSDGRNTLAPSIKVGIYKILMYGMTSLHLLVLYTPIEDLGWEVASWPFSDRTKPQPDTFAPKDHASCIEALLVLHDHHGCMKMLLYRYMATRLAASVGASPMQDTQDACMAKRCIVFSAQTRVAECGPCRCSSSAVRMHR